MENPLGPIAYKILFNDEPERLPNPNKPENIPRIKAMQKAKEESFKRFWNGVGKPLMDRWQDKVRTEMFTLLLENSDCTCPLSSKLREITTLVKMLSEAQLILNKEQ